MAAQTLYDKLWESHVVRTDPDGTSLLYIDRHLVHEVTSPQAFEGLKLAGWWWQSRRDMMSVGLRSRGHIVPRPEGRQPEGGLTLMTTR